MALIKEMEEWFGNCREKPITDDKLFLKTKNFIKREKNLGKLQTILKNIWWNGQSRKNW